MSEVSTSSDGSTSSGSERRWPVPVPRDTTPEIAELQHRIWMAKDGRERLEWWLRQIHAANMKRSNRIREQHPEATEGEITALWMEET